MYRKCSVLAAGFASIIALSAFASGCGSNAEGLLYNAFSAAGRSAFDIWLTDFANQIADQLDNSQADDNGDDGNGGDNGGDDNGNGDDGDGNGDGTGGGLADLTGDATAGETVYTDQGCAACHCADASGGCLGSAPALLDSDRNELDDYLRGDAAHPAKPSLSDQQIVDMEAFFVSLGGGGGDDGAGGGGDSAAGQTIFANNGCAGCHCADASGGCLPSAPSLIGVDLTRLTDILVGDAPHAVKPDLSESELADLQAFLAM